MKTVIIAYTIVFIVIALVVLNSLFISYNIKEVIRLLNSESTMQKDDTEKLLSVYNEIYDDYRRRQKFLSITVNHEDLTTIETEFEEILGSALADDKENIIIAKSRLIGALEHIRRLSGINIDSIL